MESRKCQLQNQIIEAIKANDDDLYSLLKSQWAHRFGVESLEELKSLDLNDFNQKPASFDMDNQIIDQSQEDSSEADKKNFIKDDNNKEKEIKNKKLEPSMDENDQAFKIKSNKIFDKENNEKKASNSFQEHKTYPEIKALIPLPPKPKYSYLKKWLLGSKF